MKNDIKRRIEEDTELEAFKFDNRKPKRFGSYKESLGVSEFDSGKLNRFKGFEVWVVCKTNWKVLHLCINLLSLKTNFLSKFIDNSKKDKVVYSEIYEKL